MMKKQYGSIYLFGLCVALGLSLVSGTATADVIAWDMVASTSQNLVSFNTNAPVFNSPGDGFQKYTVGTSASIPYALVDDTNASYPPDDIGIIDAATDFHEFFGATDTVNDDNADPVQATWVFDISSGNGDLTLQLNLAAMGDFEATDFFQWSYQVDSGPVMQVFTATADEAGSLTYTMADGTTRTHDDPLVVGGTTLSNVFQPFVTPITPGSQLSVVFSASTDGGTEAYTVRNIQIFDSSTPTAAGNPIPALSGKGVTAMALLFMAVGVFLIRRLQ